MRQPAVDVGGSKQSFQIDDKNRVSDMDLRNEEADEVIKHNESIAI